MNLLASLRYLVALHEHRHFGRAAQACHITQPALSNALRALEHEFGVVIVRRGRSFAGFTAEGERVLASARQMLREREVLQQDLQSQAGRPQGRLLLGAVPAAVPVAARFAARLQALHPGIVPTVRSMSSPEIEAGLDLLQLDLGLGYSDRLGASNSRLELVPQYVEHYHLVRRARRPAAAGLRQGPSLTWTEAARLPLCLLTPEMHNRSIVDAAFAGVGVTVVPAMETNSILTLAIAVAEGQVCSVVPGAVLGAVRTWRELEALPLKEPDLGTPVALWALQSPRQPPALAAALALARDPDWLQHAARHSGTLAG